MQREYQSLLDARLKLQAFVISAVYASVSGSLLALQNKFITPDVAGFMHSSAALTVGPVHAGLNLYNNGFAAGIVASVLVPVIIAIQARTQPDREPPGPSGTECAPPKAGK